MSPAWPEISPEEAEDHPATGSSGSGEETPIAGPLAAGAHGEGAREFCLVGAEAHESTSLDGLYNIVATAISVPAGFREVGPWDMTVRRYTGCDPEGMGVLGALNRAAEIGAELSAALTEAFAARLDDAPAGSGEMMIETLSSGPSVHPSERARGITVVKAEIADRRETLAVEARQLVANPDPVAASSDADVFGLLERVNRAYDLLNASGRPIAEAEPSS